ncbi:MAG: transposase [Terriglobia bacterium]
MTDQEVPAEPAIAVDTYGGCIHVEWDPQAAVTPLGQLPFFIEFLKTAELFGPWVRDCPLTYGSPNAPRPTDVLGTLLLSVLAGHWRYAHITTIRSDQVNPPLLGMRKVVSEDSVRRALRAMEEDTGIQWLQRHLRRCYEPLLYEPWILDMDVTIKPLYGHQEGADVGYNPHKPGRPAQAYHAYWIGNLRLALEVEVHPGKQTASKYTRPGLWHLLDELPPGAWPSFLRGDCAFGTDGLMREAEARRLPYLFKLKQTPGVKRLLTKVFGRSDWRAAGQGWEGVEASLQLQGWGQPRRVVVLRRVLKEGVVMATPPEPAPGQQLCVFLDPVERMRTYEYVVLVTSLPDDILTLAQHYRDRADMENNNDELKNQWGWGGYTTQDLKRCQLMARLVALVYNWWSLFVRLAIPERHAEALTSRPLLLEAVGRQTSHSGQTTLTLTSRHAKAPAVQRRLRALGTYLRELRATAEQLDWQALWRTILSRIFASFLDGRPLRAPMWLPNTS